MKVVLRAIALFKVLGFSIPLIAQVAPSNPSDLSKGFLKQETLQKTSLFKELHPRKVGPVVMSGRVTDFAVTKNPKQYYVSFASGGVFVTKNFGASFEPVFDHIEALGIGDIALDPQNEDIIWVGTGEKNSSRSSYAGSGIYKSSDAGKNWEFMGLGNSQHIGRIVVHPTDSNVVWVASIGPLYSFGGERGVYKTSDGGKSWKRTLFIDDSTGVIDLVVQPGNPNVLFAASWQRVRQAWNFFGSGKGSGIWKSQDSGETWEKVTIGLPSGETVGRIGLDISPNNSNRIYALIDNLEETKTAIKKQNELLYADDFIKMSKKEFLKLDNKALDTFLKSHDFPEKYSATSVKSDIENGVYEVKDLSNYSGNANDALFETQVKGAEVYRSDDAGSTWEKVNSYELDGVYFTYGYYFGEVRVNPSNSDEVYVLGVPMLRSQDAGKTWKRVDHSGVHVDHQALWIDPNDSEHILLGNDGGIYSSFDGTKTWTHHNNIPVGQFYTVNIDFEKPYNIYGGLQDNGVYFGSSKSVPNKTPNWEFLMGGDGMHVAVNPMNNALVYTGFQFGNYYRIDKSKNERKYITPKHDIGKPGYRFNWNTPVVLSVHNPDIIYMGAQKLLRSVNKGDSFEEISPDLTTNYSPQGNVPYSTITDIEESSFQFGFIWIGTDDGKVQLTENGGGNWVDVSAGLPKNMWVSKIVASPHDINSAYVSLTGYRFDHFAPYAFVTHDKGKTWTSISEGLPFQAVNCIIPDLTYPNLLFAGTDFGGYYSLDSGKSWQSLSKKLPNVAVYDMIIHPRDHELVLATHGRSMYVLDIKPIYEVLKKGLTSAVYLYELETLSFSERWGQQRNKYTEPYFPELIINYYTAEAGEVNLSIIEKDGKKPLKTWKVSAESGYNSFSWNLVLNQKGELNEFLQAGDYEIIARKNKSESKQPLKIKGKK